MLSWSSICSVRCFIGRRYRFRHKFWDQTARRESACFRGRLARDFAASAKGYSYDSVTQPVMTNHLSKVITFQRTLKTISDLSRMR